MKTFLVRSMIGIFFGAFIAVIFTYVFIFTTDVSALNSELYVKNSLGSILCGWLFAVSPLYFEIKSLQLPMQTCLHFLTTALIYLSLSVGIGWIPFNVKSILLGSGLFIFMYSVIWICFYLYFKNHFKKINKELKEI